MTTPQGMLDEQLMAPELVLQEARELLRYYNNEKKPYTAGVIGDCIATIETLQTQLASRQAAAPQGREALEACRAYLVGLTKPPRVGPFVGVISSGHPCHALIDKIDKALTPAVAPDGAGEWRCFHCEEIFTDRATAAEHFGISELETPGCKLNAIEGGLLGIVRRQEDQLQQYHREDTASYREFYSLGADHSQALRREEEKGYARGLADGRALARAQEPGKDEKPIQSSGGGVESRHAAEDAVGPEFAALHPSEQSGHAAMGKRDGVLSDLAGVAPGPPEAPPPQVGSGREEIARPGLPEALRAISQRMRSIDGDRDHMNTSRLTCADTQAAFKLMDMAADALRPERSGGRA